MSEFIAREMLDGMLMERSRYKLELKKKYAAYEELKLISKPIITEPVTLGTFVRLFLVSGTPMMYMHPNHYFDIYVHINGFRKDVPIYRYYIWSMLLNDPSEELYRQQLLLHLQYKDYISKHPEELLGYGGEIISRFFPYKDWLSILDSVRVKYEF